MLNNNHLFFDIKLHLRRSSILKDDNKLIQKMCFHDLNLLYICTKSAVGDISLKTLWTAFKNKYSLMFTNTIVFTRSPGVGVSFQTRSTDTSCCREPTRGTSENAWPRPSSTRCWRWRWGEHGVPEKINKIKTLRANLCLALHNKWWSFVLCPHPACPSGRDQTEAGGVRKEGKSAQDQGTTFTFEHCFSSLLCKRMTHDTF